MHLPPEPGTQHRIEYVPDEVFVSLCSHVTVDRSDRKREDSPPSFL
jgi:hypothetical protein